MVEDALTNVLQEANRLSADAYHLCSLCPLAHRSSQSWECTCRGPRRHPQVRGLEEQPLLCHPACFLHRLLFIRAAFNSCPQASTTSQLSYDHHRVMGRNHSRHGLCPQLENACGLSINPWRPRGWFLPCLCVPDLVMVQTL